MKEAGKQATELAAKLYRAASGSKSRSENESVAPDPIAAQQRHSLMMRLWLELDAIFGMRWDGGDIDGAKFNTWLEYAQDLEPHHLARGIKALRNTEEKWPPSWTEFRQMCAARDPAHRAAVLPPPRKQTATVAANHLAAMREAYGMPPKPFGGKEK